jgi:hydrogenase-4 component B
MIGMSPLAACIVLLAGWIVIGIVGLARPLSVRFAGRVLFLTGALCGAGLALVSIWALNAPVEHAVLPIGLPDLPFHLRLDALSAVFLFLLGATSVGISVFGAGYFRAGEGTAPGLLCLQYHVFLSSMGFVLIADDAYAFMFAWEVMALASYFLVTTQHRIAEIRRAGFLYLLIAHLGALGILLCFGVLQGRHWEMTFDAMRAARLTPEWATFAFLLAFFGFGAKAGLVPLHVWLPEAHPAAPSPVSALMSGVMLKIAVYGILRVCFDLIGEPLWWWGLIALGFGLFSALYGVVFAAAQTDMKRLLAYSSIENIGIACAGVGLALVFAGLRMDSLAALAVIATLYHCLNHALMKSLLFLGTGAVLHATGQRNLGKLGGLMRYMPWTAWLTLIGALAIASLPPLNGFVSEWLLLQAFLFTDQIPRAFINMLLPLGAAVVALSAALAAYVMVKFYGVIFLGVPRESALVRARDCGRLERLGLAWLGAGCVLLGMLPVQVIARLNAVSTLLVGTGVGQHGQPWWLLAPLTQGRASYGPVAFFIGVLSIVLVSVLGVRLFYHRRVRFSVPWDCGFGQLDPRMQDTAEGFGQPVRHVFQPFFRIQRELPAAFDLAPKYRVIVTDRIWYALYEPLVDLVRRAAGSVAWLQQGRVTTYLLYSFITLLVLLGVVLT